MFQDLSIFKYLYYHALGNGCRGEDLIAPFSFIFIYVFFWCHLSVNGPLTSDFIDGKWSLKRGKYKVLAKIFGTV